MKIFKSLNKTISWAAILSLLLQTLVGITPAFAATTLDCNSYDTCKAAMAIAVTGDTINLTAGFSATTAQAAVGAINFNGKDGITFEGNGFVIDGPNAATTTHYGIYLSSGSNNNVVKNVMVQEFYNGIVIGKIVYPTSKSSGNIFENVEAFSNKNYGLHIMGDNNIFNNFSAKNNTNNGVYISSLTANNIFDGGEYSGNQNFGIYLQGGSGHQFMNLAIMNNGAGPAAGGGVALFSAGGSVFDNVIVDGNTGDGFYLQAANGNTVKNSQIYSNTVSGISNSGTGNSFFNNIFSNVNNVSITGAPVPANTWNATLSSGTNIIGGPNLGGNFWTNPSATGFSDTCVDANTDGICDVANNLATNNVDDYPLTTYVVADTTPQVIDAHADVFADATDPSGAIVDYVTPDAIDNIDAPTPAICSPASGSVFPVGTTDVACNSTDAAGNIADTTHFNVVVSPFVSGITTVTANGVPVTVTSDPAVPADFSYTVDNSVGYSYASLNYFIQIYGVHLSEITTLNYVDGSNVIDLKPYLNEWGFGAGTFVEGFGLPIATLNTGDVVTDNFQIALSSSTPAVTRNYTVLFGITSGAMSLVTNNEAVFTILGVDNVAPVITVSGANPVDVSQGSTYTDAGATATDNVDPTVTVVTTGTVDTSVLGTYTLTYTATDAAGNVADPVIRTVNVVDTTVPVITRLGNSEVTVEAGAPYSDAGATASDNYDGDITGNIITVNPVNTNVLGDYTVTYNVVDSSDNNAITVTRTVHVVDTTLPLITIIGNLIVQHEVNTSYNDAGATASDNYDGEITSFISTVNNVINSILGNYNVLYNVSDSSGNAANEVVRTVNVIDTTVPVITRLGNSEVTVEAGAPYSDAGATASDNYDGDITGNIITVNPVNTNVLGDYTVTYNVVDSSSNSANTVTRIVHVVDTTAPTITLLDESEVTLEYGDIYTDPGATAQDSYDGDITSEIDVQNLPDTSVLGDYIVTYNAADSSHNSAVEVTRTVHVVPRNITVTADAKTKVFGEIDPQLTYQITTGALVGVDVFTGSITRSPGETAGTYSIDQGSLALSSNYGLTFTGSLLSITAAPTSPAAGRTNTGTGAVLTPTDTTTVALSDDPTTSSTEGDTNNTPSQDVKGTSDTKKTDLKSDQGFFGSTWLGVFNWVWMLLAAIAIGGGAWWLLGVRRNRV